jgi:isoquinoline 1-oxidoreductase subunit beta
MSDIKSVLITRRSFIAGLGITGAGFCLGFQAFGAPPTNEPGGQTGPKPRSNNPAEEATSSGLNPNVFIHVASTGAVTIVCHRSEMGQGIRSSLPVLLADELGADMKQVTIVQADGDKAYGDQNTDGSNSIRGIYVEMRKAAATARMMLIGAAAAQWKVSPATCTTENGFVLHKGSKRKIAFGELAVEAGKQSIPKPDEVKLRPDKELKRVGKQLPLIDGPAYVNGTAKFGADVKRPNMLIAVIARPPVLGAEVAKYNEKAALKISGVQKVVKMPQPVAPYGFQPWGGVAVLADNTWSAIQGRNALEVGWKANANSNFNSEQGRKELIASIDKPGTPLRNVGDVEQALSKAAKTIEADYFIPHLPHVAMEPPCAIAEYSKENGGSCEIWAPTQNPQAAKTEAARVLGLPEEKVTVHVTFLGGGFGRKSKADFVSEAAWLSKSLGRPVRVQFTREDDIRNDYVNAVNAQRMTAGLDAKGKVIAWRHRTAFTPIGTTFDPKLTTPAAGDLQQGVLDVTLAIPNVRAEVGPATPRVRVGWLRSVYNIFHSFAVNSFIDEIAHAQKRDPREVMLEIYGPAKTWSLEELGVKELKNYGGDLAKFPVDAGRLRHCIEDVTKRANWKSRNSKKGRAFGLAAHRSFLSYSACVVALNERPDKTFYVDEVWLTIDPGHIVNPDRVRAQMEGSVLNGMNHALYGGVTLKDGMIEQSNFDGVQLARMNEAPRKIHVQVLQKEGTPPGGIGEPGVPPVAPAIANALFALTGKRHRELGFLRT